MKRILVILISILTLSSQTMAYEEANYEIINENNNYEIRKYFYRLVIETNTTQGNGFRKLFIYPLFISTLNIISFLFSIGRVNGEL